MIELELPWPPSVNTYYRTFRGRMIISKAGREYRQKVQDQGLATAKFSGPVEVEIEAFRPDNRRRDIDNVLKASLDALTHAKVWEDDSQIHDLRIYWAGSKGGVLKVKVRAI